MDEILKHWSLEIRDVKSMTSTTWSINDQYILKRNKSCIQTRKNIDVMILLGQQGYPTPKVVLTRDHESFYHDSPWYYTLMEKVQGRHLSLDEAMTNKKLCFNIGKAIAELHEGLKTLEGHIKLYDNIYLNELKGWIKEKLTTYRRSTFAYDIYPEMIEQMTAVYFLLPRQPIHRDVHLKNMIFQKETLIGYIDFDISQINARIFDLAYFGVGILVEIFYDEEKRLKWPDFMSWVIEGYESIAELQGIEKDHLYLVMCSIEILFVAYHASDEEKHLAYAADDVLKWLWSRMSID